MALVLDGTNGVSGVDGTASNPAIEGTDSNTGIFYPAADTVAIGTNGTERVRVVSAGDVGVGTSTPATISNRTVLSINNASNGGALNLLVNGTETLRLLTDNSSFGYVYNIANQPLVFGTNNTERMRLDASGNLGIGTSSPTGGANRVVDVYGSSSSAINFHNATSGTAATDGGVVGQYGSDLVVFNYEAGIIQFGTSNAERARITSGGDFLIGTTTSQDPLTVTNGATINGGGLDFSTSGTKNWQVIGNATDFYIGNQTLTRYAALVGITTFTAWTFVSDRRLKHEIKDIEYGLSSLMQIKPREFKFIKDNQSSIGFIAQELKQIIPEAVMGDEIEFNENDSPEERAAKTMSVSKEMLIPVLVKAIQELNAKVESLEAQLKGNA